MSGRYSEAAATAELALAVYRQPALHAELLRGDGPLPSGVAALLRLAGGTEVQELDPALAALAPESELRKAALFFVEEVLFQREATHYRVLGLNQDATADQVKEHHRLLMRLFHPDRSAHSDERREHFATRANLAYNALRDAGTRARYDETLKPPPAVRMQTPHRAAYRAPVMPRRHVREPDSYWAMQVYPKLMRHLPQWVLAGTALVSVTVVGAVYLYNPPINLQNIEPDSTPQNVAARPAVMPAAIEEGAALPAADETTQADEAGIQFEHRLADAHQAANATTPAAAVPAAQPPVQQPVSKPTPMAEAVAAAPAPVPRVQRQPAAMPAPAAKAKSNAAMAVKPALAAAPQGVQKTAPAVAVASPVAAQKSAPAEPRPAAQPAAEPAPGSVAATTAVAAAEPAPADSPRPALPDPNMLLAKFLEAYEKGDMKTCMALLDDGMRGKSELRREYDALFRSTDLRHINILSMNWAQEGDSIRGEGQYRSTVMRKGETILRSQGGKIRVELIRRGNTELINELQYIASARS